MSPPGGFARSTRTPASWCSPLGALTDREREVLGLLAEGLSNRAIATRLSVTDRTVEAHITAVFAKLGLAEDPTAHRRVLAVLTYLRG